MTVFSVCAFNQQSGWMCVKCFNQSQNQKQREVRLFISTNRSAISPAHSQQVNQVRGGAVPSAPIVGPPSTGGAWLRGRVEGAGSRLLGPADRCPFIIALLVAAATVVQQGKSVGQRAPRSRHQRCLFPAEQRWRRRNAWDYKSSGLITPWRHRGIH